MNSVLRETSFGSNTPLATYRRVWIANLIHTLYLRERFTVQTSLWSLDFTVLKKSRAQHHSSFSLSSKQEYLKINYDFLMGSGNFFHTEASLNERRFCLELLLTFKISHSLVRISVANIGTSSTHWQYSTIIFINISNVLRNNWVLLRFAEKFYSFKQLLNFT